MFQCGFIIGLWAICCKISISQEWFENLFQTIHFSTQTCNSIPHLGVHQSCQACHPPVLCIPLRVWNFSKHYPAFCTFSVWLSFAKSEVVSAALPMQPQEEGKALPGDSCRSSGDAVHVRSPDLLSLLYMVFSWKIFNTEAIIFSLFYYPWLFSVT